MADQQIGSKLTIRILIGMVAGAFLGFCLFKIKNLLGVDSQVVKFVWGYGVEGLFTILSAWFIASLKMLVVPLVFVSLVCGVCSIGGSSRIGSISAKTLGFYLFTTAAAISIALLVAVIVKPGVGTGQHAEVAEVAVKEAPSFVQVLIDLVPSNVFNSMVEGSMLQIIIFALLLGVALAKVGDDAKLIRDFFISLDKVIMQFVIILMNFAPYGVFCLIAILFSNTGLGNIEVLAKYFGCVVGVLFLHAFITYGSLLYLATRLNPLTFFKKMIDVWVFGFSTASSNASLPVTLNTVEKKLGVNNQVASFTVPLGATINMDGTSIMQGVATVFIAQYYAIDIGFSGYLMVILTATMASIGTAGVPGVGLIMLTMVLTQAGLPAEGVGLIIGVDRLLDMIRTSVNVTGDAVASVIIGKSEKMLDVDVYNDPDAK